MSQRPDHEASIATLAVHGPGAIVHAPKGPATPIHRSAAFEPAPDGHADWAYSRLANPTVAAVASRIATLEGTEDALLTASGTSALLAALLAVVPAGGLVAASRLVCGDAYRILVRELPSLGRRVVLIDPGDERRWAAIAPSASAFFVEAVSNPTLRVADIERLAAIASGSDVVVIVDATLATPVNLRPALLGADLVVHSATKALNGHGDVTAGVVAGSLHVLARVRDAADGLGACLDPGAASLLERGLKTLPLRVERQNETARIVARTLVGHPGILSVCHPALPSHPDHELAGRVLAGSAGLATLRLRGGADAAERFLAGLRLIGRAPTLGGVESLALRPWVSSHAELPWGERRRAGIRPGMIRLSLGIEDAGELLSDIEAALEAAARRRAIAFP
ncbi:MAG TPA: PLP-dependent transferase [Gaiellales bacterium]